MRRVGVREFKNEATAMMSSGETIMIERHGKPIGFFIPIKPVDREAGGKALAEWQKSRKELADMFDMTEDELIDMLSRPLPDDDD